MRLHTVLTTFLCVSVIQMPHSFPCTTHPNLPLSLSPSLSLALSLYHTLSDTHKSALAHAPLHILSTTDINEHTDHKYLKHTPTDINEDR